MSANPKEGLGIKKAPMRYTPPSGLIATGQAMAVGAEKYGPFNWRENPVEAMTYVEAMHRHLAAWQDGQDLAEDTEVSHLGHIAASCFILIDAMEHGTLIDNRVKGPAAATLRKLDKTQATTASNWADVHRDKELGLRS